MKIVLVCLNGMSTGDLVNKMNKISIEKIEGESLNADTMSAIDELMSGGGISCQSFDEYKRKINE